MAILQFIKNIFKIKQPDNAVLPIQPEQPKVDVLTIDTNGIYNVENVSEVDVRVTLPPQPQNYPLNIHYGDTPPTNQTALWVKGEAPNSVCVGSNFADIGEVAANVATLPEARANSGYAWELGKCYIVGGHSDNGTILDTMLIFNTDTLKVEKTVKLPFPIANTACILNGYVLYAFGGYDGEKYIDTILCYNTKTDEFKTVETKLPTARCDVAVAFDEKTNTVFIIGGVHNPDGGKYTREILDEVLSFNTATEKFSEEILRFPTAIYGATATLSKTDGNIYVAGGFTTLESYSNKVWQVTQEGGFANAKSVAFLPFKGIHSASLWCGDEWFIVGGRDYYNCTNQICAFSASNLSVRTLKDTLPISCAGMAICLNEGKILVFGGANTVFRYNSIHAITIAQLLPENHIYIKTDNLGSPVTILSSPSQEVSVCVSSVYRGDFFSFAQPETALTFNPTLNQWVELP